MPQIVYVHPDGRREEVAAVEGQSIMKAAVSNLVDGIVGECGGDLSCATCHVYLDEEWAEKFPPREPDEESMLEATAAEPEEFSRLSCQLKCSSAVDGVVVRIPEAQ